VAGRLGNSHTVVLRRVLMDAQFSLLFFIIDITMMVVSANSFYRFLLVLQLLVFTVHAMATKSTSALKRIVVTGGNKGIGKAICKRLLLEFDDTFVILGARDEGRGRKAVDDILKEVGTGAEGRLECMELDVSSDDSVSAAAARLAGQEPLYGIVNNAGVSDEKFPKVRRPKW